MDSATLVMLGCAVFGASCLQSATGIGYGVIAGPVFLVALDGIEAFQISTIHNLCIALILLPVLWRQLNARILHGLVFGSLFGIAAGFYLQVSADVLILKIAATLMVLFVAGALIRDMHQTGVKSGTSKIPHFETLGIGGLAGIMGGMLAMPGPLAATWMSIRGVSKQEVRGTVLAFFVFAYGANLLLYAGATGYSADVLTLTFWMMAPLVAGIAAGNKLSGLLSEFAFRCALLVVLLATIVLLTTDWVHLL